MALLSHLQDAARARPPVRVAVAAAAQAVVLETMRDATRTGLAEPLLIGDENSILQLCDELGWAPDGKLIVAAANEEAAAYLAVQMVRNGDADAVMKGNLHTDVFMRALLDSDLGLRLPDRRVSHVFVVEVPGRDRLIGITDAAINIAPDLRAKAEICQNAIDLFQLLGVDEPKVAVLSAVETVTPGIVSTLDAACLTLMARRGQIHGAKVDGPLAFDNAISTRAAAQKSIASDVAGAADILLLPDLVSGNILAKSLEYLADAVASGIVMGLSAPVVLSSRADPAPARISALAIAALMHHRTPQVGRVVETAEPSLAVAPQPEHACCPLSSSAHPGFAPQKDDAA